MRTKNNTFQTINTKLQCICAMKEYLSKSMEELRMEDYQANRKFPTAATSVFGATTFAAATPFSPAPYGTSSNLNQFFLKNINVFPSSNICCCTNHYKYFRY
jgi:nuclear pore complex protein Nup98-Nup96